MPAKPFRRAPDGTSDGTSNRSEFEEAKTTLPRSFHRNFMRQGQMFQWIQGREAFSCPRIRSYF